MDLSFDAFLTPAAEQAVVAQSVEARRHCVPAMANSINKTKVARKTAHCGQSQIEAKQQYNQKRERKCKI